MLTHYFVRKEIERVTTLGLFIGIAVSLPMLWVVRNKGWDRSAWSLFMMTLPIWYALFGLLALDISVIANELIYGLPYFMIGFWRGASFQNPGCSSPAWVG